MRRLLATALFAAMATAAIPPAASTQDAALTAKARAIVAEIEDFQDKETYRLVGQPRVVMFKNNDEEKAFEFTIDPKKEYMLAGFCDDYCDGVDMWAEDANDDDVGKDMSDEAVATISVAPNASGSKVKATVFFGYCPRESCLAGAALFEVLH